MVTPNWKSLTDRSAGPDGPARIVSDPIEHQGVRDALRGAYGRHEEMPREFQVLLAKIR